MLIVVKGLNHYSAPLAVREKFALPERALGKVSAELQQKDNIREALLLCTCNRTELYVRAPSMAVALDALNKFVAEKFQVDPEAPQAREWFYHYGTQCHGRNLEYALQPGR